MMLTIMLTGLIISVPFVALLVNGQVTLAYSFACGAYIFWGLISGFLAFLCLLSEN